MKGKPSNWEPPLYSQDQPCAVLHRDSYLGSHPHFTNTTQVTRVEMSTGCHCGVSATIFFLVYSF